MSCSPSARTIICNEIFDENSLPSEEEVLDYAVKIGIDPDSEPHLLHLARDGLMQALPPGWKPCFDEELQTWYYFNFKTGESRWEHPLDDVYRRLVAKGRSESLSSAGEEDSKTSLKEELRSYEEGLGSEGLGSAGVACLKRSCLQLAPLKRSPLSPVAALPGAMVAPGGRVAGGRVEPLRVDLRSPSDREALPLGRSRIDIDKMGAATLLGEGEVARRPALPPAAHEKHPRSLSRAELKLSGGGSVFLKSRQQQETAAAPTTPTSEDTPALSAGAGGSGDESSTRRGILREQRSGSSETRDDSVRSRSSTPLWEMNPAHMTGEQKQQWRRQELEEEQRKSVRFNLADAADLDIRFQASDDDNGSEDYEEERLENNKEQSWDSEEEDERRVDDGPTPLKKVTVSIPDVRHITADSKEEEKEDISTNEDLCPVGDDFKLETQVERTKLPSESVPAEAAEVSETSDGCEHPVQEADANGSEKDGDRPVTWCAEVSVVQSTVIYDRPPEDSVEAEVAGEEDQGHSAAVVGEGEQVEEVEEEVEVEEEAEEDEEEEEEEEDEEQAEYVSGKEINPSAETDSKEHTTESKGKENVEEMVQANVSTEKVGASEPSEAVRTSKTRRSEEDEEAAAVAADGTAGDDVDGESSAEREKAPPVPKHRILRRVLVQSDTVTESEDMVSARETVAQEDGAAEPDAPGGEGRDAAKGERVSGSDAVSESDPLTRSDVGTRSGGLSKSDPLTKSSGGASASERVVRSGGEDAGGKEAAEGRPVAAPGDRTTESDASEVTAQSDASSRDEGAGTAAGASSLPAGGKAAAAHSEDAGPALSRSETVETSPDRELANGTASTSDSSPLPKLVQESQGKPEDTAACTTTTTTTTTSSGTGTEAEARREADLRLEERLREAERQAAEAVRRHRERLRAQAEAAARELEAEQEQRLSELAERLAVKEEVERERIVGESRCRLDAIRVNTEQQERILRAECEVRLQQLEADCRARLEASRRAHAEELARAEAEDAAQLREARARLAELQRQAEAAVAEREALLARHRKELAELEKEVRPEQLSEEHREALDKLRAEQAAALQRIRAQFQREEEAVRQEHAERLEELKVRLELERQRLWDRGLADDNESARQQLVETSRVFEKLRCEKRLLEDKYRTLKEKYLRLKTDVKISMERRKRREAALNSGGTGSDSERIVSQRATGTSGPVFERSKSLNTEKARPAADRQRQPSATAEGGAAGNRGDGAAQGKLLTGDARESHNINDTNKGGTNGSSNNNNNNNINNTGGNNTNNNNSSTRRRRQLFGRHHSTPVARTTDNNVANNNNNMAHSVDVDMDDEIDGGRGRSCSPVENLRRQLRSLEDLEDQFPAASHTDTYLRYPFSDTGKFGSSELEFFRHRIHLERDSVRRAKDFLRVQRDSFQARQSELRQRQEGRERGRGPSARAMLDQLYKEERELTDMEVSLHRTRSLLGEKIIRLRHLEQSLQRAGAGEGAGEAAGAGQGATLSDLSSHSGSSGFSSTELATDTQGQVSDPARRGAAAPYQESTEIIKSLECLNTEIRDIWEVLNRQQKDGNIASNGLPLPPPPPLAYTWVPPVTVPVAVPAFHPPPLRRYAAPAPAAPAQPGVDRSLVERTRSLRDWLRQARLDGSAAPPGARAATAAI